MLKGAGLPSEQWLDVFVVTNAEGADLKILVDAAIQHSLTASSFSECRILSRLYLLLMAEAPHD